MPRDLSSAATVGINSQETAQVFVSLLTFSGGGLASPIRLCDTPTTRLSTDPLTYGIVSRSNTYTYLPIRVVLPTSTPDETPKAKLALDNVSRYLMADLRTLRAPMDVLIEIIREAGPDLLEFAVSGFQLRDVTYTAERVEGALLLRDLDRDPFPGGRFTPGFFPGLFG